MTVIYCFFNHILFSYHLINTTDLKIYRGYYDLRNKLWTNKCVTDWIWYIYVVRYKKIKRRNEKGIIKCYWSYLSSNKIHKIRTHFIMIQKTWFLGYECILIRGIDSSDRKQCLTLTRNRINDTVIMDSSILSYPFRRPPSSEADFQSAWLLRREEWLSTCKTSP